MPALRGPALVRYRLIIARQRAATSSALAGAWDALPSLDEDQVATFARRVAPVLAGAKSSTVSFSTAFYAQALSVAPPSVAASTVGSVAPVRDPFVAAWHALAEGRGFDTALEVGRSTAQAMGDTFIQSTARQTGDVVATAVGRDIRFERVAEPDACDWCQARDGGIYLSASDGDYGHDRCHCDVVPVDS